ncbi:inner centromere protein-like isoform X2 [Platichthys flesus]|uniref:inner centromere protein-like isoform X2 n=1 Tax=Platichthys flesus TaxID=8260 RepID=UPI002DBF65C6|nr:inner centromere protein-like isoform X2 [Platichthys flesus]
MSSILICRSSGMTGSAARGLKESAAQTFKKENNMDEREIEKLQSESEKKSQIEILKMEISGLRELNVHLQQNLQLKTAQEKEQLSKLNDLERERDHLKAEEMARIEKILADSAHSQTQILQKLEQQLKKQGELESMQQQIKEHHESEKNKLLEELSRIQSAVCGEQERSQQLQQEMGRKLQEKQKTIKAQREQLQGYRDQNGNMDKRNFKKDKKITVLDKEVEQKFAERTAKRPAGGVSILRERIDKV